MDIQATWLHLVLQGGQLADMSQIACLAKEFSKIIKILIIIPQLWLFFLGKYGSENIHNILQMNHGQTCEYLNYLSLMESGEIYLNALISYLKNRAVTV